MAEYILIHGAFFGGWCWDGLAAGLRKHGHIVHAPTLTGLAERCSELLPTTNLDDHIADVIDVVDNADGDDLIVAGHSYGGMPTMGAIDQRSERIGSVLFLDAFVPGHSDSAQSIRDGYSMGQDKIELPPSQNNRIPPISAEKFGFTGEMAEFVDSHLTPHPDLAIRQPITLTNRWRSISKKTYLRTLKFPAPYFDLTCRMLKDEPDWHVFEQNCRHCPMLTDLDWLLEFFRRKL